MSSVYGDDRGLNPHDIPEALGKPVRTTHYVDANLFHDMNFGRSVTGIVDFLNQTPIDWFSRKQATVETQHMGLTSLQAVHVLRETLTYVQY